ncbi:hypothetical protein J3R82DRAFT_5877 [Butyriboletus roseoflavus]|nr:hypothetical protein J3R82DRAFT_5877 [Butyriboletus roseoflavus]
MSSAGHVGGYRVVQLPDFSNNRRRHHNVHLLFNQIALDEHCIHVDTVTLDAFILVAYANVLGMYCGVTDVLLSLEGPDGASSPFRLKWDETTTWLNALEVASIALKQTRQQLTPPLATSQPFEIIELAADRSPFIAVFRDSSRATSYSSSAISAQLSQLPLLIHAGDGLLHLRSPSNWFSSSMASMLLRQIVAVVAQVFPDVTQKVAAPLHLNNDLASVVEALPEHERATYYSHIPPARFATDYILPHSVSNPHATAVQWYPDLSPDMAVLRTPECLSYSELNHAANRFARFLLGRGLSPEDRVAVCMDRDLLFHSVFFGILRAGGCYVPIDPELPMERKLFIARNSSAKFVIVSSQSHAHNPFGDLSIGIHDMSIQETISGMSDAKVDLVLLPEHIAYMLYTSGTTGNPKGCLMTHNGLSEAILALSSFPANVKMADICNGKYLAIASIAFDVHLAEILVPLALGMTLVSAKRGELLENLPLYISLLGITHIGLVPSLIDATMCAVEDQKGEEMKLRYIASGGEKISDAILDKWTDHSFVRLANFYGPSEVTIGCCARFMDGNIPRENVGRAFANVASYVVDDNLNILPRGVVGELVVAGPLVGRGYHELPDLTANSFMEWPYPGSRSYRTGDLVRMLPDGTLHIIGRIDTQIKLRGIRIETEGISAIFRNTALSELGLQLNVGTVLATHPSIGNGTMPQLVSFVAWAIQVPIALRRTTKPHVVSFKNNVLQVLQAASEKQLASYMRPAHIIRLSWLPLNPNGKTDDKALSAIFREINLQQLIGLIYDTPAENYSLLTDIQQKLVSLVENHIDISPIDSRTSLFAYGMDSLSLVRLVSDIRRTFHASIAVADVMNAASIKSIGELIRTHPLPEPAPSSNRVIRLFSEQWFHVVEESVPHIQVGRVLPPFPIQEGVLYHSDSRPTACVQHVIMSISDQMPLPRVRDAWEATMQKLDILRTVFYFGRQLVQVILTPTSSQLPWTEERTPFTDANSFSTFFYAEVAPSLAKQINGTSSTIPPFRLVVFSAPDNHQDHWLTLSIHHALFDGVSLPLILKFVEDELLERPHPFTCSSESLLEYMHSATIDAGHQFWAARFSNFDWSGHRLTSVGLSSQIRRKAMSFTTSLTALGKRLLPHQVTMHSVLTCAFALSLARHIHHTHDVAFVVIRAGRLLPVDDAEHATYPTINVLPTRVRFDTEGYLQRVQADISAAVAFEHISLSHVQKWLPPGTAPFDTLFAVTVKDDTHYEVWDILRSELPEPDFPLSIEIVLDKKNDTLLLQAAYYDCESLAIGVGNIFHQFEAILHDILNRKNCYVPAPAQTVRSVNPVSPMIHSHDDVEEDLGVSLDAEDIVPLKEIVSKFFGFPSERLRPYTSLISLGLDSIRSVGLSKILRQHGYATNAADIMGNPILRNLGVSCARSLGHSASVQTEIDQGVLSLQKQCERILANIDLSTCKLSIDDEVEIFPTTALQTGMISQTVASAGNLYFHSFVLDLDSDTNLALLQNAWNHAVHDFDILRTTFHYVAELASWVQARHSIVKLDWQEYTSTPLAFFQHTVDELFSHLKPTDVSAFRKPPIHLRILRSDPCGLYLVLFIHHALYDGLSIPSLLSHVEQIYQNQEVARPAQFFDFIPRILSQQDHAIAYWTKRLKNYRPATLLRNTSLSSKGIVASRLVSVQQELLVQLVHDNAVTLQCLAQAVWAKYLASLASSNDVVFGHVVSGRSFDDSEEVVGPMLNTIPCRVQVSPSINNRELLSSIHRANVDALPWQHVSLRVVQSELQLHGLLSSLFLFQPWRPRVHNNLWTLREPEEFDTQIQYPLNIEFHEVETGFLIKMACRSDAMDPETLSVALADIDVLVNEMVYHPDNPATAPTLTNANQPADVTQPASRSADATCIPAELLAALASVAHCPVDNLSPSQSPVAIGVDSITAIRLSTECRKAGLTISVWDIVSSSTIGELVSKATRTDHDTAALQINPPLLEITTEERQAIIERFPERRRYQIVSVSTATEGMKWLIAAWQRSFRQRFHHVFAYKLSPDVSIQQLREAWKALMLYHPILRSTFASAPGYIDPRVVTFALDSKEADLTEECVEHGQDLLALAERMETIVMSPLPISAAQTKGFILTSTSTSSRYLLIRMHHFQYDALSLQLLLEDLSSLYLGSSPQNIADTSAFSAAFAPSLANLSKQRLYWQSVIPSSFLPIYLPPLIPEKNRPPSLERIIVTITSAIPGVTELKKQAQAIGIPLHCILLASWASVQAFYSASDHATFGLWHAGRAGSVPNVLNLAIPCMNVLPVHIPVSDNLLDVARTVQQDLYKRTPVIQQSNLRHIDGWITGGKGYPLTNVFVNVFEIVGEDRQQNELFTFVEIDHTIPVKPLVSEDSEVIDALPITKLLQDDVMVDIVINEKLDAVTMSIESIRAIMDVVRAKEIIDIWATRVRRCLSHMV